MRTSLWPVVVVVLLSSAVRAEPPPAPDITEEEKLLKDAGVKTDGPALIEFFRKRVPPEVSADKMAALIKQLGDDDFDVREKATADLRAIGVRALPALRRAANNSDEEVKRRVRECIAAATNNTAAARSAAAARVLAIRKPPESAAVLLNFLPFAEDDDAAEQIVMALITVGVTDGKLNPAIAPALTDKEPARRAAAALLLGRHGNAEQKTAVRKLLTDSDANIRLRAAQGLLAGRDKAAIPVLLALLDDAPLSIAHQAEDLLVRAAVESAPAVGIGETKEQRTKGRAAWETWWKANEAKVDLTKADVELQLANPTTIAKETVRRMMDSWLLKGDLATVKRLTDVPFAMYGREKCATREQLDQFLGEVHQRGKNFKGTALAYKKVVSVDEYLRDANRLGGPEEAKEMEKLRKGELRVVYVELAYDGHKEMIGMFVRVVGRARVVGLGPIVERATK